MNVLNSLEYRKAFGNYLRRGTPIHPSLKAEDLGHPTTHYIWRTRGDPQVRPSHIENNGKVFAWDNPPETGHPGEDYNCRCTAEPYERGDSEYAYQTVICDIKDNPKQWNTWNFIDHFRNGGGRPVTLSETGNLAGLIFQYFYPALVIDRINADHRRCQEGEIWSGLLRFRRIVSIYQLCYCVRGRCRRRAIYRIGQNRKRHDVYRR